MGVGEGKHVSENECTCETAFVVSAARLCECLKMDIEEKGRNVYGEAVSKDGLFRF